MQELPISLGSDDALVVWLNGEKLHSENIQRAAGPDQAKLTLKLKEGNNQLLLKIVQWEGEWAYYFKALADVPQAVTWAFEDVSDTVGLGRHGLAAPSRVTR